MSDFLIRILMICGCLVLVYLAGVILLMFFMRGAKGPPP